MPTHLDSYYNCATHVSRSELMQLEPPSRLQWYRENRPKPTPEMIMGTLVHQRILEPHKPMPRLAVPPEKYPATDGTEKPWTFQAKYCKDWRFDQEAQGKLVITRDKLDALCGMVDSVLNCKQARWVFDAGSQYEVPVFTSLNDTHGRMTEVRSLVDIITDHDAIGEIKTNGEKLGDIGKLIYNRNYHVQAAFYLDAVNARMSVRKNFFFIFVESDPPYACDCVTLSDEAIQLGREEYMRRLAIYNDCVNSDSWPTYPQDMRVVNLPSYAK